MVSCVQAKAMWIEPSRWPVSALSSASAVEKPRHPPPPRAILRLLTHQAQWGSSQAPGLGTAYPRAGLPNNAFKKYTMFQARTVLMTVASSRQLPMQPEALWPVSGFRESPL